MAAQTGATTRELMARLGHSSPRAALIYQHATEERDHTIAAGLDALIAAKSKPAAPSLGRQSAPHAEILRARFAHGGAFVVAGPERKLALTRDNNRSGRRESNPHDQLGRLSGGNF